MKVYAHRGASGDYPENTLLAFASGIEAGAEGIELDVQVSADRVPVILHDRDLRRTTSGSGAVESLTIAELKKLDAGAGERIPTLAEVLKLAGDRVHFDIEIKQGGIEAEVLAVLAAFPESRWAISSFDWTSLERVRALSATAEIWLLAVQLSDALFGTARRLNARAISFYSVAYTQEASAKLKAAGLETVIWTVNDVAEAARVRDLGALGLCTDYPARIIAGLS